MRHRIVVVLACAIVSMGMYAQSSSGISFAEVSRKPSMRWNCPEIEKYQGLLNSLRDDDPKVYANHVKERFELYSDPASPDNKFLVSQASFTIENPLFSAENLLNHISTWIRKNNKEWGKEMTIDLSEKKISATASISVAQNASFLNINKVSVTPGLVIQIAEDNRLDISFAVDRYKNDEYGGSDKRYERTFNVKISEVFPFVPKSSHKNTYAKAYVGTYLYFWDFISGLFKELNSNFSRDAKLLAQLHYTFSRDSLLTKYGEPTKVIAGLSNDIDIRNEMYFYESSQKIVFMGKTIDFKDVMSCEIIDDPQFIPGRTTTYGGGIYFFGLGLGGAETRRVADKTIHNYVVDVKIDNLGTPFIRIATGQDEHKATEIASSFEYILRHQQSKGSNDAQRTRVATRRSKR